MALGPWASSGIASSSKPCPGPRLQSPFRMWVPWSQALGIRTWVSVGGGLSLCPPESHHLTPVTPALARPGKGAPGPEQPPGRGSVGPDPH